MATTTRIAVIHDWNPCQYTRTLRQHLEEEAPRRGVTLQFVAAPWSDTPGDPGRAAVAETLEAVAAADGLILVSGVFPHGVGGLLQIGRSWAPRPIVSIAYRLPAVPSLMVDNRTAVRLATTHLIEQHSRRRLLFLRGRLDSQEAEDRYLGFRCALPVLPTNHIPVRLVLRRSCGCG